MTYADRLAERVGNVLKKQVRNKGYEIGAVLSKKENSGLGITDNGDNSKLLFSVPIRIIITSHDVELFPMELGDNPDDILDFIWMPPDDFEQATEHILENGADCREVDEGLMVRYAENDYTVTLASPTSLGGNLIIKECRAKKVR